MRITHKDTLPCHYRNQAIFRLCISAWPVRPQRSAPHPTSTSTFDLICRSLNHQDRHVPLKKALVTMETTLTISHEATCVGLLFNVKQDKWRQMCGGKGREGIPYHVRFDSCVNGEWMHRLESPPPQQQQSEINKDCFFCQLTISFKSLACPGGGKGGVLCRGKGGGIEGGSVDMEGQWRPLGSNKKYWKAQQKGSETGGCRTYHVRLKPG